MVVLCVVLLSNILVSNTFKSHILIIQTINIFETKNYIKKQNSLHCQKKFNDVDNVDNNRFIVI